MVACNYNCCEVSSSEWQTALHNNENTDFCCIMIITDDYAQAAIKSGKSFLYCDAKNEETINAQKIDKKSLPVIIDKSNKKWYLMSSSDSVQTYDSFEKFDMYLFSSLNFYGFTNQYEKYEYNSDKSCYTFKKDSGFTTDVYFSNKKINEMHFYSVYDPTSLLNINITAVWIYETIDLQSFTGLN